MNKHINSILDPVLHPEHPQGGHESPAGRSDRARRLHLRTQERV